MNPGGVVAVLVVLSVLVLPLLVRMLKGRRERAETQKDAAAFMQKAAEGKPPMTAADVEALERWLADNTLPYAALVVGDAPPADAQSTRLGGSPWLPEGKAWPLDHKGGPLVFLAQLNFAEMPPLPDFPPQGLLLLFIADDDLYGANFDSPEKGDFAVIFVPDINVAGASLTRPAPPADATPFQKPDVEQRGRGFTFKTGTMSPRVGDWRIEKQWPAWWARGGDPRFQSLLDTEKEEWGPAIHTGGQARFTQNDVRAGAGAGALAGYDRVLLQVGSCDEIMWGDVGEAVFLIRREDLLARDFSQVVFSWDCH